MNTSRVQILAKRVIQQMLGDRRTLALIAIVPIVLLSALGILIRENESEMTVGIVNDDAGLSMAGNTVSLGASMVNVLKSFTEFETQILTEDEAHNRIKDGKLDAVIRVPSDFTQQVIQTHHLSLNVEFEGSNPMLSDRLTTMFERVAVQSANALIMMGTSAASTSAPQAELTADIDATYLHSGPEYDTLDYMAPALIGFFVFFFVFLLTCISFLRERVAGTLERLQATPIRAHEIILGYIGGFLVFGLLQGVIALLFTVYVLKIHYAGNLANIFVVEFLLVLLSVNLGIFLSTFAQNEFQVLQFIPLVVVSQALLGGVIWQIEDMPDWLQPLSYFMPLTYATKALRGVMIKGDGLLDVGGSLLALLMFGVLVIALSSRTASRVKI